MANQVQNYPCPAAQALEVVFQGSVKIGINDVETMEFPMEAPRFLRVDGGLISGKAGVLTVRNRTGDIRVRPMAGTIPQVTLRGGAQEKTFRKVKEILIQGDGAHLHCAAQRSPEEHTSDGTGGDGIGFRSVGTRQDAMQHELKALRKQIEEMTRQREEERNALNRLKEANRVLEEQNADLRRAASANVEELEHTATSAREWGDTALADRTQRLAHLQQENQAQQELIAEREASIRKSEQALADARQHLEALQQQVNTLRSQKEITDLDCEKATEELEELKIRLQMDGDIMELTEDRFLKNNSVADTLEELKKKIEAAEKRIAFILKAREGFDRVVQDAVLLTGDGTISLMDESGGNSAEATAQE